MAVPSSSHPLHLPPIFPPKDISFMRTFSPAASQRTLINTETCGPVPHLTTAKSSCLASLPHAASRWTTPRPPVSWPCSPLTSLLCPHLSFHSSQTGIHRELFPDPHAANTSSSFRSLPLLLGEMGPKPPTPHAAPLPAPLFHVLPQQRSPCNRGNNLLIRRQRSPASRLE